jgi:hypothetical protein
MNTTTHNPFLARNEVTIACNEARVLYLDTLARMQQNGGQPVDWLERMKQKSQLNLDGYWEAALKSAFANHVLGASTQLAFIVKEWVLYRALADLIDAYARCTYLDPADPDTYNDIERAISHQVVYLATELLNELLRGNQQRQVDQQRQQQDWQHVAHQQVQQNMQHQTDWHQAALGTFRELRTNWEIVAATNREYADTALRGVKQAQDGVRQITDFVVATQSHVVGMHEAFQQHVEQNLPDAIREAARKETRRRRVGRLMVVLIGAVCIGLLIGLAYYLIIHLY